MDNYVEITLEAFKVLVNQDAKCLNVDNFEHANVMHYFEHGIKLKQVDNFLSCVSQYYIEDINA